MPLTSSAPTTSQHHKDRVECVKILVCMANSGGGYVVLGVETWPDGTSRHQVIGCPEEHLGCT
jgi:hypothetical protein